LAKPAKTLSSRAAAAVLAQQVIDQGRSLDRARDTLYQEYSIAENDRPLIQELLYGVCRWYGELNAIAAQLLSKPIRNKDRIVHFILLVGLYQLHHLETARHAAVAETVNACKKLNKQWAGKLINACLRAYLREPIEINNPAAVSHPEWLVDKVSQHYPDHAERIFIANNERAPMCLRVNQIRVSRDQYLEQLAAADITAKPDPNSDTGIILERPIAVNALPSFEQGACSVQDTAAQIAATLLSPQAGMRVLDACAAPGGKTAHLLELANNDLQMDAMDISESRCEQLKSTLTRLNLNAEVISFDASRADKWPSLRTTYHRILIDAPCSGTGVIRRHQDIKHHRRLSDLRSLQSTQASILRALWPRLETGGLLLYATCSILPEENEQQIEQFVAQTNNAILKAIEHPTAMHRSTGCQTLAGLHEMDGFYYCLLEKI